MARFKDTRPLTSKDFQRKVASELSMTLVGTDFKEPIDKIFATGPSQSEFNMATEYLIRQIDPNFIMPSTANTKPEEYYPKLAKYLGYPYQLKRDWFKPVGVPTSWPYVLGFLQFLLEMVNAARAFDVRFSVSDPAC